MSCLISHCNKRPHDVEVDQSLTKEKKTPCRETTALLAKVGLVGAATFAIYANWGQVVKFFSNVFSVITTFAKTAMTWVVANPVLSGAIAIAALIALIAMRPICCSSCGSKKDESDQKADMDLPTPPGHLREINQIVQEQGVDETEESHEARHQREKIDGDDSDVEVPEQDGVGFGFNPADS